MENDEKVEKIEKTAGTSAVKKSGIIMAIIGAAVFIVGLVFFLVNIFAKPGLRDAEYLVEIGEWEREDAPGVIWKFTEVGKGTLTTNGHVNDYEFIWALDGDKIKIETEWLYALEDEYVYALDQDAGVLRLGDVNFRATSRVDAEVTEDD